MAELNKCPFCGGKAELKQEKDVFSGDYSAYFQCKNCGARTKEVDITCRIGDVVTGFNPLQYIEMLWNTRATEAEIRAKAINEFVEKLKENIYPMSHGLGIHDIEKIAEQLKESDTY